jgi:hypothetical protein
MTLAFQEHKAGRCNIFNSKHVKEYLGYLIDIIQMKRKLRISVRDITLFIGLDGRLYRTQFGILLNKLCEVGLAERVRNLKPRKYRLKPESLWIRFVNTCNFRCESEGGVCSLAGICPYWVLRNALNRE